MSDETEKRVYIGDCGCVRIESKHFRATFQAAQFIEMLREIVATQKQNSNFSKRLRISSRTNSGGFARF